MVTQHIVGLQHGAEEEQWHLQDRAVHWARHFDCFYYSTNFCDKEHFYSSDLTIITISQVPCPFAGASFETSALTLALRTGQGGQLDNHYIACRRAGYNKREARTWWFLSCKKCTAHCRLESHCCSCARHGFAHAWPCERIFGLGSGFRFFSAWHGIQILQWVDVLRSMRCCFRMNG